jgi:hypothetical protein
MGSSGWINRYKRRHDIVCRTIADESRSVDSRIVEGWKNQQFLRQIKKYDICNFDEIGLFFNLQSSKSLPPPPPGEVLLW